MGDGMGAGEAYFHSISKRSSTNQQHKADVRLGTKTHWVFQTVPYELLGKQTSLEASGKPRVANTITAVK